MPTRGRSGFAAAAVSIRSQGQHWRIRSTTVSLQRFKKTSRRRWYGRSVIFRQFVDDDLGCASYLVGDERHGVAAVIDPSYAVEQYLDAARRHHVRIVTA